MNSKLVLCHNIHMKQVRKPDQRILQIISQASPSENRTLKMSQFALSFEIDNKYVLFHTLTKECLVFESIPLWAKEPIIYNKDNNLPNELISHRFLVSTNTDETEMYFSLLKILRSIYPQNGIKSYTILPTTFCNARCFYCYELGYHFMNMPSETADQTIRLITETHSDGPVQIRWFGGEPLLGITTIRKISAALKVKNILFHSAMISNGYLFDESIAAEAKEEWNLRSVQITLDGDENEYNLRKNYIVESASPYKKVINSIRLLQKAGIRVNIRLNIDQNNIESIKKLAEDLDSKFPDKNGIFVYSHPLFYELAGNTGAETWRRVLEAEQFFHNKGFDLPESHKIRKIQPYFCMADSPSQIVVNADGNLYSCEHCHASSKICSIEGFLSKPQKKSINDRQIKEKCRSCAFLPDCTDFSDCPNTQNDCIEINRIRLFHALKNLVDQQ